MSRKDFQAGGQIMVYRVTFKDGSSDFVEGTSAADAREIAEADFGQKVVKVEVTDDEDDDLEEDDEEEDGSEEDDSDDDDTEDD